MTSGNVPVFRIPGVVVAVGGALLGVLPVGAALVDIIRMEEPDLTLEWTVAVVAGLLACCAAISAALRRHRSRPSHTKPHMTE
jgi:hypothetical protein